MRARVSRLEERVEDAEAYERKDTLVITGKNIPPAIPGQNDVNIVCDMFRTGLKLNVSPTDVSTAHRIGVKSVNRHLDTGKIILKLCRRDLKGDILNACRQIKPKDIYINESLTPTRNKIMYILRSAKKKRHPRLAGCSSFGGRVFAWVKPAPGEQQDQRPKKVPVNTRAELEAFCEDILQELEADYIQSWQQ